MNLVSCDSCAVVLNKDKMDEPPDLYAKETGCLNEEFWGWDGEEYQRIINCPVCKATIFLN